jgi:hypothetical protein
MLVLIASVLATAPSPGIFPPSATPTPVPPLGGSAVPPWVPVVLGGLVGALLVFALTQLVTLIHDRRDFRAAVIVVLDELQANADECGVRMAPDQIKDVGTLLITDVLTTDRFESVQLILARRLPVALRGRIAAAYRAMKNAEAHVALNAAAAAGVLAVLRGTLRGAETELRSYSENGEKVTAWLRPAKRVSYTRVPGSGEHQIGLGR